MATLLQVLQTLTTLTYNACYPNGTGQPSVTTRQISIESGFPIRTQQDHDLAAGYSHVYVYPTDSERVVTKFQRIFQPMTKAAATIVLTVVDNTVVVTGTVTTPQAVTIIVNGIGYGYQILSGDTTDSIAANTAAIIPGATSSGNVITIPNEYSLIARVATAYTASEELSRSDRIFCINVVSPNFTDRSTILDAIDVYLKQNYRITLPDNYTGMVFYNNTIIHDDLEQYTVFKGWLNYTIQYPTTLTQQFTTITDPFSILAVNE
jgi:hypothetical protein